MEALGMHVMKAQIHTLLWRRFYSAVSFLKDQTDTSVTQLNVCNTSCAVIIIRTPFYWAWCSSDISTSVLINAIYQSDDNSDAITYNNNTPIPRLMDVSMGRLTHLPLDKMAAILADEIFKSILFNKNDIIPIQHSLKFVAQGSIDKNRALV